MKRKIPQKNFRKVARLHAAIALGFFGMYLSLSVMYSPDFLLSDIKHKYSALADDTIMLVARVVGGPAVPIVSGSSACDNGTLSNSLSWPLDEGSKTFNIDRNGLPLVSGLSDSSYTDSNISAGTSYSYTVTAIGPMNPGIAVSLPFTLTAAAGCAVTAPPIALSNITISKNADNNGNNKTLETTDTEPLFSGSTNVPYAIINIMLPSSVTIFGQTVANANGYWTWTPPTTISQGSHTLLVTAQDPTDSSKITSATLNFQVVTVSERSSNNEKNSDKKNHTEKKSEPLQTPPSNQQLSQPQTTSISIFPTPLDFSISLSPNIIQGKQFVATLNIEKIEQNYSGTIANIRYSVLDKNGNEIFSVSDKKTIIAGQNFSTDIQLPSYLKDGTYKLVTEISNDSFDISKQTSLIINPAPAINLGGGIAMTYPQILSKLGSIAIATLLSLLIWIFLFSREYWLYLHALRNITEKNLEKSGMISLKKRKGVSK